MKRLLCCAEYCLLNSTLQSSLVHRIIHTEYLWHVRRVDWSEGETIVTELTEFLLAVLEPLDETLLVDELDGAGADAGVEQRPVRRALAPAHAADV